MITHMGISNTDIKVVGRVSSGVGSTLDSGTATICCRRPEAAGSPPERF